MVQVGYWKHILPFLVLCNIDSEVIVLNTCCGCWSLKRPLQNQLCLRHPWQTDTHDFCISFQLQKKKQFFCQVASEEMREIIGEDLLYKTSSLGEYLPRDQRYNLLANAVNCEGVETGIRLAKQHNIAKVVFCMDSMNMYRYLATDKMPPWEARHIVRRIKMLLEEFEDYRLMHAVRETNQAADKLASLLPSAEYLEITPSSFAEDLKKIIFDDVIGRQYTRL